MSGYFTTAEPLPKEDLVTLFESVAHVTQLLVAPFGLSEDVDLILGEDVASNDYKSIYRSWEDCLSMRLYRIHNMPEDRIAASMQVYVEKKHDPEILQILRRNESYPSDIIRPADVVELPSEACPELAIAALQSVITALQAANNDFQDVIKNRHVQLHQLNSIYSSDIYFLATTLSQQSLEQILTCLSSIKLSSTETNSENFIKIKLSYAQYVALIDAYQNEPQIQELFMKLLSETQQTLFSTSHLPLLKFIRYLGTDNLPLYSIFCHPILSAVFQIQSKFQSLQNLENVDSIASKEEELYFTTLHLLDALERIQQHKKSSSAAGDIFGMSNESETGDTLQIMCVIDEVFGKDDGSVNSEQNVIYRNENIPNCIRSALLVERASCRMLMQELDEALRDVKLAISLDPKNPIARKCRYSVYHNMAGEADGEENEPDELDLNGASSDDERGSRPPLKRLLMKAAFEALAAFVLGGSSNLALAGDAEDAAREACRDEAKAYFWRRQKDGDGDGGDDDDDYTDDDDDENDENDEEKNNNEKNKHQNQNEGVAVGDINVTLRDGDVSSLCRCTNSHQKCDNPNCGVYFQLINSSCMPKRWMVSAFQAMYAPIHQALDIPLPSTRSTTVLPHEDGLGEDGTPFDHLVSANKTQDENGDDDSDHYYDQPEGDDDAFNLICRVANALSRGVDGTDQSINIDELENEFQKQSILDHSQDSGIIKLTEIKKFVDESLSSSSSSSLPPLKIQINKVIDPNDLITDLLWDHNVNRVEDLIVTSSGSFPKEISNEKINSINPIFQFENLPHWNCSSSDFLEAFSLVTTPLAHELTGVNFVWKEIPSQILNSHLPHQRFRISAGLTPAMQDAICDRSMHNSMHMVESYESDDSESCGNNANDEEEESIVVEEKQIKKVSRQLRARLLSLCGSIAYLLGDSMGGYECMKASILLEGESLDSRIKIATMLMEMDELDKAEVHLNDARRKWPNAIVVDLHEAELFVHRTDYTGAVELLRKASHQFDDYWSEEGNTQRDVMEHLGPSIFSLRGVAEFRVAPDNPELALSVLRQGVQRYPRCTSLLLCLGEVLSQAGDPSSALKLYSKVSKLEPGHPMSFLNASRVYQQLNQKQLAKLHMKRALQLDEALSLTLVDIAQYKIQESRKNGIISSTSSSQPSQPPPPLSSSPSSSLSLSTQQLDCHSIDHLIDVMSVSEILDYALYQARHVSEILDIFTAKQIATFYQELQDKGLVSCIV